MWRCGCSFLTVLIFLHFPNLYQHEHIYRKNKQTYIFSWFSVFSVVFLLLTSSLVAGLAFPCEWSAVYHLPMYTCHVYTCVLLFLHPFCIDVLTSLHQFVSYPHPLHSSQLPLCTLSWLNEAFQSIIFAQSFTLETLFSAHWWHLLLYLNCDSPWNGPLLKIWT